MTISSVTHLGLINTPPTATNLPIIYQNCIVLAYRLQSCSTRPLKLEIRFFNLGLTGFPCQIFIEAETLEGHHQNYSCPHKKPTKQQ